MKTILIIVDYEEFKPETYKGVYLFSDGVKLYGSSIGNFEEDYHNCVQVGHRLSSETGKTVINSSSVDDWYNDQV